MPYTIHIGYNRRKVGNLTGSYAYFDKSEAIAKGVDFLTPPLDASMFNDHVPMYVETANGFVVPILRVLNHGHIYYTPFGKCAFSQWPVATGMDGLKRYTSKNRELQRIKHMAQWITYLGEAQLGFRFAFGRAPEDAEELDTIMRSVAMKIALKEEWDNMPEDKIIPIQEIMNSRMRQTRMMEDVITKFHDRIMNMPEDEEISAADVKTFRELNNDQQANLIDLETGYVRNTPEPENNSDIVEMNYKIRAGRAAAGNLPTFPKTRNPEDSIALPKHGHEGEEFPEGFEPVRFNTEEVIDNEDIETEKQT